MLMGIAIYAMTDDDDEKESEFIATASVSYTHLDVYKRQAPKKYLILLIFIVKLAMKLNVLYLTKTLLIILLQMN